MHFISLQEWQALEDFNYNYFKSLYNNYTDSFRLQEENCDFLSYDGRFNNLQELFAMTEEEINMADGRQWYVGW